MRTNDAKIVRSKDAQCNTEQSSHVRVGWGGASRFRLKLYECFKHYIFYCSYDQDFLYSKFFI